MYDSMAARGSFCRLAFFNQAVECHTLLTFLVSGLLFTMKPGKLCVSPGAT